jgi:hypothetical protein
MVLGMPMPKGVDVDDYMSQLPKAAVPHLTVLRGLSLTAAPDLVQLVPHRLDELPITGPGW